MSLPPRLARLLVLSASTLRETLLLCRDATLRRRWLDAAAIPLAAVLAGGLVLGLWLVPDLIATLSAWLAPDLREKLIFGLSRARGNPLRPWIAGALWALYGAGVLALAARAAWQRRPQTDSLQTLLHEPATVAAPPAAGEAPRYRIETELGRGAMGIVYRAEDTRLRRAVALKVLAPHVAHDAALRARFLREAQAIARLNHPGIVQVYDLLDEGQECRIAMEFVPGPSLAELAARQPQALHDVLRWGGEIAEALASAHDQGVVHRDLKPANVLMAGAARPKITDFGLARLTDGPGGETQIGTVMGSPAYMSPEQAAGETTDARTDIYAFGVLLYELLAGRPPFTGESTRVMAAHITREPDPVQTWRTDVPAPLAALVMQLLAKAPEQRPASLRQVATTLAAIARDHPAVEGAAGDVHDRGTR